ncbi:hypothetical protein HYC85_016139 [Camellia sinensis]|uniref:BHLH domain-containing protein n=1 Tax=Camellia sinensis TaxID=4442 RepID=A0A7J7H0W2_CAMSI|nr:hypothetical protein HYC85_016139 [Camellia sinensis]
MDGFHNEENKQPSSSSGSVARRLFDEYRQRIFNFQNGRVPGRVFKNGLHFMELKELELQGLASVDVQLQFYREARIKTAIFMGCTTGEIELGMSNDPQVNELGNGDEELLPRRFLPPSAAAHRASSPSNRSKPPFIISSSLRSLSTDSPEPSPFLFNIASTSYLPEPPMESNIEQALRPISTSSISPLEHTTQAFRHILNPQFPSQQESNEASAMAKALLTVISSSASPSSSSSSHQRLPQTVPPNYPLSQKTGAFKSYRSSLGASTPLTARARRQNLQKRAISFFRTLSLMKIQERVQGTRPTSTQLHHMISERKRREKLNDSFQALRSLLPPGTKKDKASVLAGTTEYLTSLKAQVAELTKRTQSLEAQILPPREANEEVSVPSSSSSNQRLDVLITNVAELTSESRIIDLQVIVRRDCNMLDLVIRTMEFLKQVKNVNLISVEADTRVVETNLINRVVLRLRIEGGDWDESSFQEAVRRVVADLAQ